MVRQNGRLLSQAVFMYNGSKNTINGQLVESLDKADVQLAAIQAISNDNFNLDEEAGMLPPSKLRCHQKQQPTRQTSLL